jgi:hypothetical protein
MSGSIVLISHLLYIILVYVQHKFRRQIPVSGHTRIIYLSPSENGYIVGSVADLKIRGPKVFKNRGHQGRQKMLRDSKTEGPEKHSKRHEDELKRRGDSICRLRSRTCIMNLRNACIQRRYDMNGRSQMQGEE